MPWDRLLRWFGTPRDYRLTRWLVLRLLGVVYVFALLGLIKQGLPLLGSHGLTPVTTFLEEARTTGQTLWDLPTIFWWDASDGALQGWALLDDCPDHLLAAILHIHWRPPSHPA